MITMHWTYLPVMNPANMNHDEVVMLLSKAVGEWNKAMRNLVSFQHGIGELQVRLFFGNTIDKVKFPNRVAECRDKHGSWEIEFDIRTKWNNGVWWKRMLGIGQNFIATSIHELGHVMDLPHSSDYSHIMHSEGADSNVLSKSESLKYRQFYLERKKFNN